MFAVFKLNKTNEGIKTSKRLLTPLKRKNKTVVHPALKVLVAINILGAMLAGWIYFNREENVGATLAANEVVAEKQIHQKAPEKKRLVVGVNEVKQETPVNTAPIPAKKDTVVRIPEVIKKADPLPSMPRQLALKPVVEKPAAAVADADNHPQASHISEKITYTVAGPQVYFHSKPDERTRRNAFINRWNKAKLKPLEEENGFVYIVYTNSYGQTSKGWMLKKYLKPLN